VEVAEARFPLFFERHEYRPGSGGDGQYGGGAGCELLLRLETASDCKVNTAGEGVRHAAAGRKGGRDGAPHDYRVRAPGGDIRVLKTKEEGVDVQAGTVFEVLSGGGGGWGDPAQRTVKARAADEREGLPPYLGRA
jgi:N-methylhydantoinase B